MIKFNLKSILGSKEMTQKELSEKSGVRLPTISNMCTNKNISEVRLAALNNICKTLNIEVGELIKYIED